jgi:ATP-dependent DNA helicase RecG
MAAWIAKTKGTVIRTVRKRMKEAQLTPTTFEADRERDAVLALQLLHHFLGPEDLVWLNQFEAFHLDESDSMALLYLREVGAIDNAVYRSLSSLDTLKASAKLRHPRDLGLLEQKDKGPATYYVATGPVAMPTQPEFPWSLPDLLDS